MKDGSMVIFCIKDVIWYTEHRILWCYNVVGTIPKWWNNPLLIFIWYTEWLNDGDHHQNFQHQWGWILWVYDHHQPIKPIILKPFLSVDFYINTAVCLYIYIYVIIPSFTNIIILSYSIIRMNHHTLCWEKLSVHRLEILNHPPMTNHVTWMLQVSWNFDGMNIKECFLSHWNYYGCQPSNISIPVARPANLTVCYWKWPIYSWFTQL